MIGEVLIDILQFFTDALNTISVILTLVLLTLSIVGIFTGRKRGVSIGVMMFSVSVLATFLLVM